MGQYKNAQADFTNMLALPLDDSRRRNIMGMLEELRDERNLTSNFDDRGYQSQSGPYSPFIPSQWGR
jgi:hypothetical protein